MSLIKKVAELQNLAAKSKRREPDEMSLCDYTAALRNAAPEMLSILSEIRPCDGLHIKLALAAIEFSRRAFTIAGKLTDDDIDAAVDGLRRYQAIAARMEAEE